MNIVNKNTIWLYISIIIYGVLAIISLNNFYFWDNIQQTSIEAHWFYWTDFGSLFITPNVLEGIGATGYHSPLMGLMTALLWKIIGYELWVSHAFITLWSAIFFYNVWKLVKHFLYEHFQGIVFAIIVLESAVLTQFSIASPDFILLTAFVMAIRAILERKKWLLAVGIFFLCTINMRGVFAGVIIYIAHNYYEYLLSDKKFNLTLFWQVITSYLPTILILSFYYVFYILKNGWFVDNAQSSHYVLPSSVNFVIRHAVELFLRTVENGRFIIWLIGSYVIFKLFRNKQLQNPSLQFILMVFLLLTGMYVFFIFITQIPFGSRYFMPQFVLLTLITTHFIIHSQVRRKFFLLLLILFFELTGHFWIYPDNIAKPWDTTLSHLPYYELRKECFDYIETQNINFDNTAGGFCIYGNRQVIELRGEKQVVSSDPENRKYFIHSNISNNEDSFAAELKDTSRWKPVKHFQKRWVYITLYARTSDE